MELWIRSQDGSNLKKVNNIYIEHITKDYDSWVGNIHSQPYVITSDNGNLGFYATEERALMILDEIQNILQPRIIYHEPEINYDDMIHSLSESIMIQSKQKVEMELKEVGQIVYQMPKE